MARGTLQARPWDPWKLARARAALALRGIRAQSSKGSITAHTKSRTARNDAGPLGWAVTRLKAETNQADVVLVGDELVVTDRARCADRAHASLVAGWKGVAGGAGLCVDEAQRARVTPIRPYRNPRGVTAHVCGRRTAQSKLADLRPRAVCIHYAAWYFTVVAQPVELGVAELVVGTVPVRVAADRADTIKTKLARSAGVVLAAWQPKARVLVGIRLPRVGCVRLTQRSLAR